MSKKLSGDHLEMSQHALPLLFSVLRSVFANGIAADIGFLDRQHEDGGELSAPVTDGTVSRDVL
jgi:hypothetical protein